VASALAVLSAATRTAAASASYFPTSACSGAVNCLFVDSSPLFASFFVLYDHATHPLVDFLFFVILKILLCIFLSNINL
jgi:hypothetical protein